MIPVTPDWIARIWLGSLVLTAVAYSLHRWRRSDYDTWESCLYLPTYLFGRLLWRVHFKNTAPEAIRRGAILVANHRSSVDPFFVQLAARRRVHWMVAKEYCQHFAFGPLLRALQVIPTNRSGMDTASTKAAIRLTKEGRLVGMFPEGRINQSDRLLLPLRSGAALVAIRSQVPMIPLWIDGSPVAKSVWGPLFVPAKVGITFGSPILPLGSLNADAANGSSCDKDSAPPTTPNNSRSPAQHSEPTLAPALDQLSDSDALIVQCGRQIAVLAGQPQLTIKLASRRKRRRNHE